MDGKRRELYLPYLPLHWLKVTDCFGKVIVLTTVTEDRRWTARYATTTAVRYAEYAQAQ